jgi:Domain of unknown function (DUF4384)
MRLSYFSGPAVIGLLVFVVSVATAQKRDDGEVVRNFVSTRDKVVTHQTKSETRPRVRPARPIGLGCTLFRRGPNDSAVRTNTAREFKAGDAVRFMIESNISGYLYVFHVENDGPAKMIFPDFRLQDGGNFIQAHAPKEVPSSRGEDPEYRWFHFNQTVAIERFYFFVTREQLPDILTEGELITYCRENIDGCPWRPSAEQWKGLLAGAKIATRESESRTFGQTQTQVERDRVTRDVGLPPGAPMPAKVKMNVSPQANLLMMNIDLIHK